MAKVTECKNTDMGKAEPLCCNENWTKSEGKTQTQMSWWDGSDAEVGGREQITTPQSNKTDKKKTEKRQKKPHKDVGEKS